MYFFVVFNTFLYGIYNTIYGVDSNNIKNDKSKSILHYLFYYISLYFINNIYSIMDIIYKRSKLLLQH